MFVMPLSYVSLIDATQFLVKTSDIQYVTNCVIYALYLLHFVIVGALNVTDSITIENTSHFHSIVSMDKFL